MTATRLDARRGPLWINGSFAVFWTARTLSWAGTGISGVVLPVRVTLLVMCAPVAAAAVAGRHSPLNASRRRPGRYDG